MFISLVFFFCLAFFLIAHNGTPQGSAAPSRDENNGEKLGNWNQEPIRVSEAHRAHRRSVCTEDGVFRIETSEHEHRPLFFFVFS